MHVRVIFWMRRVRVIGKLDESFGARTAVWRFDDLTIDNLAAPWPAPTR
jgi:hypothetical protein